MDKLARNRILAAGATGALLGLTLFGACSACGKGSGGSPTAPSGAPSAPYVNRTAAPEEAGPVAVRDVAMWTSARDGTAEDLASLATHEGAAGLVEAASEAELRPTALRAMGYARGWAQLPYLATTASGKSDDEARLALESVVELASRPRRSEDVEDLEELGEGCAKLLGLAREASQARDRRISALRALRMMPCPKQDLPADLDAK
ncbi:MAG TPA: hypothetical protein VLT33_41650 [Labilithrix sp.]|nr:hypothetical protein [Labilithrix sp.]